MSSRYLEDLAVSRRRVLALAGIGVGGALAASWNSRAATGDEASCLATPEEIRGPFPADGTWASGRRLTVLAEDALVRHDIRPSFAGLAGAAEGVPLDYRLHLLAAGGCRPLAGHALYVWQCDAAGDYSLYNRTEVNYLRGIGVADADGLVRFQAIVPGCYGGRAPHIHLEVFSSLTAAQGGERALLVSQLALPDTACAEVYRADSRYGSSLANLTRWPASRDFAFADASAAGRGAQTVRMSGSPGAGYAGEAAITLG